MHIMVSIKDEKTGTFNPPNAVPSIPDLVRSLSLAAKNNPDVLFAQFPSDFSVWRLGSWNSDSGIMDVLVSPEFLFNMVNIFNKEGVK